MKIGKWLAMAALTTVAGCIFGCLDPMWEARQFIQSEAGQKLVDKISMSASAENPEVEFYIKHSVGARALGMKFSAASEGEVTPDERGFGERMAATRPAEP